MIPWLLGTGCLPPKLWELTKAPLLLPFIHHGAPPATHQSGPLLPLPPILLTSLQGPVQSGLEGEDSMFTQRVNSPKSASLSFLSNQNPNKLIPFPWPAATNPTNPLSPHPYPSPRNNSSLRPVSGPLRPFSTFPSP